MPTKCPAEAGEHIYMLHAHEWAWGVRCSSFSVSPNKIT